MRVLVVEDDALLAELIAEGLRAAAIAVDVAPDGDSAMMKYELAHYDVVLLDRDLPGVNGDDVCRGLVARGSCSRILMLTAFGRPSDRVEGLRMGADDYLPKPFDFAELIARVQALSRRSPVPLPPVLQHSGITMDIGMMAVTRHGIPIPLSPKEFSVLRILMASAGRIVSSEELLERAWDENIDPFTSTVRITMSKLRAKLGMPSPILTVRGVGYRMAPS
ncbi:response regulator transcription factor [Streptomyces sp. NBC_00233]|uniref:response regulator transcription factor n=1 Tax=Streptomyces sp. NBC_00233 TaxID=2975686 RepID=UPI002251FB84|nr:response regulator transcription factor [Streptomyces sp. NBC_00233]MCX5233104.1 response regulator transcription factor [Streptomyces sp. NBC_00233]